MIPRRNLIAIGVIVAAALALTAFWVYTSFELYEHEIEVGLKDEARENPYLALGRFVEHYGASVRTFPVYTRPPPPGATLYFPAERVVLSARQNAELRAFAEAGGHLIVVTHTLWEEKNKTPDPLLDPLGAAQFENKRPPVRHSNSMESPAPETENDEPWWKPDPRPVSLPDGSGTLMLHFDRRFRLEERGSPAVWRLADTFGAHALRYRVGQGLDHGLDGRWAIDQRGDRQARPRRARGLAPRPTARRHDLDHPGPRRAAALGLALEIRRTGSARRLGAPRRMAVGRDAPLRSHRPGYGLGTPQPRRAHHGERAFSLAAWRVRGAHGRHRGRAPATHPRPPSGLGGAAREGSVRETGRLHRAARTGDRTSPGRGSASSGERFAQDIETLESLRRRL